MNRKRRDTRHAGETEAAAQAAWAMMQKPRLKVENGSVRIDHPNPREGERLLMKAFRTDSPSVLRGIIKQMANAAAMGKEPDEDTLNMMLRFVVDEKPIDQFHTLLLVQAGATHVLIMHYMNYVGSSETIPQQDSGERILNKLLRTFMLQMATSSLYRAQHEQRALGQGQPVEAKSVTPLAITDGRAVPMEILQQPETIRTAPRARA